ncbi:hypothetical protein PFLUV_G00082820 [Perca fluviatilis]|uniref:Uncharacterized protein n=1 Tax=Perca fluviatilis TaxID=8168 RepID=A0A6A5FDL8_PERFL|nr:hypothetical protein PFLUV_G00082820 [Perca fluviatilis]
MLFCCGDQLNVASLSGLTQQWEAPRAHPALPSQKHGHGEQLYPASHSRKCRLLALSLRDKWLQRPYCSKLTYSEAKRLTLLTTNPEDAEKTLGGLLEWLRLDRSRTALYGEMIHVYLQPCSSRASFNDASFGPLE